MAATTDAQGALEEAAFAGRADQLSKILVAGHGFNEEQLSDALGTAASCGGNLDSVFLLLRHGAAITERVARSATQSSLEIWEVFLAFGYDPNRKFSDAMGRRSIPTICHLIGTRGSMFCDFAGARSLDCFRLLLDNGADVDAVDGRGVSVLERAVQNRSVEPARLLVERGAKLPPSILFHAFGLRCAKRPAMVEFLLKAGADPDPAPIDQFPTVLHKAIRYVQPEEMEKTIMALVEAGADPARKVDFFDSKNFSALDFAQVQCEDDCPGLVEMMRDRAKTAEAA